MNKEAEKGFELLKIMLGNGADKRFKNLFEQSELINLNCLVEYIDESIYLHADNDGIIKANQDLLGKNKEMKEELNEYEKLFKAIDNIIDLKDFEKVELIKGIVDILMNGEDY